MTIDSSYTDEEESSTAANEDEAEHETAAAATATQETNEQEGEVTAIELPSSLRHGIFITPPAKLEEGLRRCVDMCPALPCVTCTDG